MNRRQFLKTIIAVPLAAVAIKQTVTPVPESIGTWDGKYLVMHPAQAKFYQELIGNRSLDWQLYGGAAGGGKSITFNQLVRSKYPMFRSSR